MLILDDYTSYISTIVIRYYISRKIILLYLPIYTTYILKLLDVGIFDFLVIAYKNNVYTRTRLGAIYYIDKVDFLEFYLKARQRAVTSKIIRRV